MVFEDAVVDLWADEGVYIVSDPVSSDRRYARRLTSCIVASLEDVLEVGPQSRIDYSGIIALRDDCRMIWWQALEKNVVFAAVRAWSWSCED